MVLQQNDSGVSFIIYKNFIESNRKLSLSLSLFGHGHTHSISLTTWYKNSSLAIFSKMLQLLSINRPISKHGYWSILSSMYWQFFLKVSTASTIDWKFLGGSTKSLSKLGKSSATGKLFSQASHVQKKSNCFSNDFCRSFFEVSWKSWLEEEALNKNIISKNALYILIWDEQLLIRLYWLPHNEYQSVIDENSEQIWRARMINLPIRGH